MIGVGGAGCRIICERRLKSRYTRVGLSTALDCRIMQPVKETCFIWSIVYVSGFDPISRVLLCGFSSDLLRGSTPPTNIFLNSTFLYLTSTISFWKQDRLWNISTTDVIHATLLIALLSDLHYVSIFYSFFMRTLCYVYIFSRWHAVISKNPASRRNIMRHLTSSWNLPNINNFSCSISNTVQIMKCLFVEYLSNR